MATILKMPAVLADAREAVLQAWLVAPGDTVTKGQPLAEIETEKALIEIEAESDGTVARILAGEGGTFAVGAPLIVIADEGDSDDEIERASRETGDVPAAIPGERGSEQSGAPATEAPATEVPSTEVPVPVASTPAPEADASAPPRRLFASPLVRRLARERGVEIAGIQGSGPHGRIIRSDLESELSRRAQQATPAPRATAPAAADE